MSTQECTRSLLEIVQEDTMGLYAGVPTDCVPFVQVLFSLQNGFSRI